MEGHTGGLTLVFTDIEGSTALLRELEGSYGLVLRIHTRVLERCFEEQRGRLVGTEGDGLFFVCPTPSEAIRAALAAQQRVESYEWPDGIRLRVRMGIHCGPVTISGGEYVGLTVHEVARMCAAAHGGQIVCSEAVATAVDAELSTCLRDLGVFSLRGFPQGCHLYQVMGEGLEADFPALRDTVREGGSPMTIWLREKPYGEPIGPETLRFVTVAGEPLGDDVEVEIRRAAPNRPGAFRLIVRHQGIVDEEFDGLTVGGPADAAAIVNAHSRLIRIQA
jgi:class 3 adenylate cyclase